MKLVSKISVLAGLLSIYCGVAFAQVTTGTPPFGSFGGGPVDTINLANLNGHISIPVANKSGRGLPFTYNLGYDTSVWYPVGSSGSQTWQPVQNFGWISQTEGGAGYLAFTNFDYCYGGYCTDITNNYYYHDPFGIPHSFPFETSNGIPLCNLTYLTYPASCVATDGSGYGLQGSYSLPSYYAIVSPSGLVTVPPLGAPTGAASKTDTNGNQVTITSGGVFTDTLGTTALTIAGSGTPSSPNTFTYAAPSGANAAYTMKYTSQTVRTNFGCSGIAEYGPTALNLVSEVDLPDGTKYTFTYEATPSYSGDVTGRLASVTLPTGGTITYTYSGGSNGVVCADGSTATLRRQTLDGTWSYAHSEAGTAWTTTITDPQGNQTVKSFQGIYATESEVYSGSATLLKTVYACYNGAASPCNPTLITLPITQMAQIVEWPGTSGLQSKTITTYNSYGLVTEKDEYAYGAGAPGSVVRKTLTTYASLTNGIVNRPASVTVEDGSSNIKSQTTYTYDQGTVTATSGTPQHVSVTGSRGNATTISHLVSGSTSLSTTFTYYDTGNASVATDFNAAQTTYTYGACGNSFVTSISEPLSLSKSIAWSCTGGVETSITDENGKTVSVSYTDAYFWRPQSVTDQLSNVTDLTYSGQTSTEISMLFNSSNSSTTDLLTTVDGLGRLHVAQLREAPGSSTYDSVEKDYDSLGRLDRVTLPYSGSAGQTSSTAPSTSTTYDSLSRKTQVTDSGGRSTTYTYTQNDIYRTAGPAPTGENAKRKQLEYDALGRLTSVCEITSGTSSAPAGTCSQSSPVTGYWTKYTYDLNNHLTGVTQNAQSSTTQTRTYTYDDLGRMTSETNPETGNIAVAYTYDTDATCGTSKGDLVKKVDPVGNTICFAYDALHRVTSLTVPSGPYAAVTPSKYLVYDSATVNGVVMSYAKTHIAEAYTCFSPCTTKLTDEGFSYTARGQVSDAYESTPHSGGYYHLNQTYWANGIPDVVSGLSGLPTITYGVDGEGRVYSATAGSGQNPLSSTTYNVASLPTAVNLGSSDSDSFSYDPNTNRMTKYSLDVNSQSVVGNLTWNAVGTLASLAVTDPFNSADAQTCSYSHDDLTRIASANCGSIWSQTFTYDAFGNISKSGTISFQPIYSSSTNQMTSIGSSTPTYDLNGNVTNDFLNTYAWDANGRPVTADGVGLTYDALGRMVEQNRSGAYTEIVYAPSGAKLALMSGSTLQKGFIPLTGGAMAIYNSSGLAYYRHADWIGSSRLASTPSRGIYYDGAYAPFGEAYAQSGTADLSFTGMNQDTAPNLYDFDAREYGIQGRWPSPDPVGISSAHSKDPQTWNRYAYVRNNPLKLIDPAGQDDDDYSGGGTGGPMLCDDCSDDDQSDSSDNLTNTFDDSSNNSDGALALSVCYTADCGGSGGDSGPTDTSDLPSNQSTDGLGGSDQGGPEAIGGGLGNNADGSNGDASIGSPYGGGSDPDEAYIAGIAGMVYQQTGSLNSGSFYLQWYGASAAVGGFGVAAVAYGGPRFPP
jgi:RHS repeat-associated protein